MTNEVKKNYNDPVLGRLTLFDMNFASKGLSWAENIYQKLEKICTDSDVVQVPCKYWDAVGEHFRMMLDEVASDWSNPSDGCVDESVSSLGHNVISVDCKKSRVGFDENALDGKLSTCVEAESIISSVPSLDVAQDLSHQNTSDEYSRESISTKATGSNFLDGAGENYMNVESIVSSVGDLSLATSFDVAQALSQQNTCDESSIISISTKATGSVFSDSAGENYKNVESIVFSVGDLNLITSLDVAKDLSQKNTCDEYSIKSISTEATGSIFSDGAGENYKNVSNSVSSLTDFTSSIASADEVHPYKSHPNELLEGGYMLLGFTSSTEKHGTCISQETMSLLGSLENGHEQQIKPNKLEDPVQLPEIEISDGCNREGVFKSSDVVLLKTELTEVFGDVNLDDGWDDAEKSELALISQCACKNMSYKKKLGRTFISKVLSSTGHKRVENRCQGIDMELQNRQRVDASSFSSGDQSSAHDSCDSGWVIL